MFKSFLLVQIEIFANENSNSNKFFLNALYIFKFLES